MPQKLIESTHQNKGKMAKRNKRVKTLVVGRPSTFTVATRQTIVDCLRAGFTIQNACIKAGISNAILLKWLAVGRAALEGVDHPDRIKRVSIDVFREFFIEVEKAKQFALERIQKTIVCYYQRRWVHNLTGEIIYDPPGPVTYTHRETGEVRFSKDGLNLEEWIVEFSGIAWTKEEGSWQAAAWYLERRDPENWARQFPRQAAAVAAQIQDTQGNKFQIVITHTDSFDKETDSGISFGSVDPSPVFTDNEESEGE